ncbi:MAG TPA: hypothetical protein VFZ16_08975 [Hyphomicrobiaceae bacterium]|nr:hypothetical protein [Hyphomicrobiaceae bacterium]
MLAAIGLGRMGCTGTPAGFHCMVLSAPAKLLVDFGLRRAHGAEAGLLAASTAAT